MGSLQIFHRSEVVVTRLAGALTQYSQDDSPRTTGGAQNSRVLVTPGASFRESERPVLSAVDGRHFGPLILNLAKSGVCDSCPIGKVLIPPDASPV
jgi:hypothetical protein